METSRCLQNVVRLQPEPGRRQEANGSWPRRGGGQIGVNWRARDDRIFVTSFHEVLSTVSTLAGQGEGDVGVALGHDLAVGFRGGRGSGVVRRRGVRTPQCGPPSFAGVVTGRCGPGGVDRRCLDRRAAPRLSRAASEGLLEDEGPREQGPRSHATLAARGAQMWPRAGAERRAGPAVLRQRLRVALGKLVRAGQVVVSRCSAGCALRSRPAAPVGRAPGVSAERSRQCCSRPTSGSGADPGVGDLTVRPDATGVPVATGRQRCWAESCSAGGVVSVVTHLRRRDGPPPGREWPDGAGRASPTGVATAEADRARSMAVRVMVEQPNCVLPPARGSGRLLRGIGPAESRSATRKDARY